MKAARVNRTLRGLAAPDMVNAPPHYTRGKYQPFDVIEDWRLGYNLVTTSAPCSNTFTARSTKGRRSKTWKRRRFTWRAKSCCGKRRGKHERPPQTRRDLHVLRPRAPAKKGAPRVVPRLRFAVYENHPLARLPRQAAAQGVHRRGAKNSDKPDRQPK